MAHTTGSDTRAGLFQAQIEMLNKVDRLLDDRDDLLAALKGLVALYDGARDIIGASASEKLTRADAAIARAESR